MQKASSGFERAKVVQQELEQEKERADKAEEENAQFAQSLREARAEVEALRGENADLRKRSEEVEHGLSEQLTAAEAKAEAEYDRAVLEVTEDYKAQMPTVQDTIWETAWRRCLTKLGVDESSPHWVNMELPSEMAAVQDQLADETPPVPGAQSGTPLEQTHMEENTTAEAADGAAGGNPDPTLATDAQRLSEEA